MKRIFQFDKWNVQRFYSGIFFNDKNVNNYVLLIIIISQSKLKEHNSYIII